MLHKNPNNEYLDKKIQEIRERGVISLEILSELIENVDNEKLLNIITSLVKDGINVEESKCFPTAIDENPLTEYLEKKSFRSPYIDDLSSLDDNTLSAMIEAAEEKYKKIDDIISDQAFLWKATKENLPPIYIFGSTHKPNFDFDYIFGSDIESVLTRVEVVYTEVELEVVLNNSAETYIAVDKIIAKKAFALQKQLKTLENTKVRNIASNDNDSEAKTAELYAQLTPDIIKVASEKYLNLTLFNVEHSISKEKSPEIAAIEKSLEIAAIKRNLFWLMYRILTETKSMLIVPGALHTCGKWGLPNLLANEGYTLTPLRKTALISKNHSAQELNQHFLFATSPIKLPADSNSDAPTRGLVYES